MPGDGAAIALTPGAGKQPRKRWRENHGDDLEDETDRLATWLRRAAVTCFVGGATPAFAEEVTLTMAVPDWPPTRIMKDLFDKHYKAPSGNT